MGRNLQCHSLLTVQYELIMKVKQRENDGEKTRENKGETDKTEQENSRKIRSCFWLCTNLSK